jgi:acyl carrier protein
MSPRRTGETPAGSSGGGGTALARVHEALVRVKPELAGQPPPGPGASLVADVGIDSLKLAELGIALEDVFGRPVYLGDVLADVADPAALTVGQLAAWMERGE